MALASLVLVLQAVLMCAGLIELLIKPVGKP
jgi:hypothetical protein